MKVGIDLLSYYTPGYFLDLKTIASLYKKDVSSFYDVLGQEQMAVPSPDEDSITQGANAAIRITSQIDKSKIKTLYFATESGIDQSKAGGMYLHKLLGLPENCRVVELKQACYSGTFALQSAINQIKNNPSEYSLIIASDIARYGFGSPGEPTQGAGAVAMLISSNPRIMSISEYSGYYAEDAMDFWRPNYKDEAFVDGQYSVRLYFKTLFKAWDYYKELSKEQLNSISYFCFHLPFTTIAEKAYSKLLKHENLVSTDLDVGKKVNPSVLYNRRTGNCYTASLYQSLASLLDSVDDNLKRQKVGLFSYGSGAMAEFFTGLIENNYKDYIFTKEHRDMFKSRKELSYDEYKGFYSFRLPQDGQDFNCPRYNRGHFRLSGISKHKRLYECVD